ncbi:MAG TPA: hypothetical protein VIE67_04805 [Rudaea sp.]|jgi:hypothetical protein|uniref:hypothetical protein n=1 Tax=Rudaea sp. TaxID=2136325 RepID=UPI002F93C47F
MRVSAWFVVLALVVLGEVLHNETIAVAAVPVVLAVLWLTSPHALRGTILVVAVCAAILLIAGGAGCMIDSLPALVASLVGWVFARSLLHGRTPLIARAIAAIDGAQQLDDAAVARYAVRLTFMWAIYQGVLALVGTLCVAHAHGGLAAIALPSPGMFGAMLPLAVAALFLGEFALRPLLIPQAPRRGLFAFLRDLVRVWPDLIED